MTTAELTARGVRVKPRIVCRFSCGAPSAVVAKLMLAEHGPELVEIVYSDTRSEHEDNVRFRHDCEAWFGKSVTVLASDEYKDIWDVFERERFIVSHMGAKCRGALKMEPFHAFYRPTDTLCFGYTADPSDVTRANRLQANSVEMMRFPLIERGLTKVDCKAIIDRAGIELPAMYRLGFNNNNCRGCPKGGMGYWNHIRKHFPADFERMATIQRDLGPGASFLKRRGERISLDQLLPEDGNHDVEPDFECSFACYSAEADFTAALTTGENDD